MRERQRPRLRYTTATRSFHLLGVFYPGLRIETIAKERRQGPSSDLRSAIARIIRRHKLHPAARLLVLRMTGYQHQPTWIVPEDIFSVAYNTCEQNVDAASRPRV